MAEETPITPQATEAPEAPAAPAAAVEVAIGENKPQARVFAVPPIPAGKHYIWGTGRRKSSVARVRIRPGTGKIMVNNREKDAFFPSIRDQNTVIVPLVKTNLLTSYDVFANVNGGGCSGQAGAISLGLARALRQAIPETDEILRDNRLLTRDARMKERKKYGQKGARKRFQFSKR
jgi:small subunit ribosomal protein S9